jgi:hypothetical protein
MKTYEISGFYGSHNTPCTMFCAATSRGTWYTVEGSHNVNFTHDDVTDGVNVEDLSDSDMFTSGAAIDSLETLENEVQS